MKKKEKEILKQEYELVQRKFNNLFKDGKLIGKDVSDTNSTPYLCIMINKIFGSKSVIFKHFKKQISNMDSLHPDIFKASGTSINSQGVFPFNREEYKLRQQLLTRIIESLS